MIRSKVVPLLSLIVYATLGCAAAAAPDVGTTRSWKIEKGDQVPVRAIHAFELTSEAIVTRLLLVVPPENHLVLTSIAEAQSGVQRFRLLAEEIGWWAEIELDTDRGATDSQAFLQRSTDEGWPAQIPAKLRTQDGTVCEGLLPHSEGSSDTWSWMAASNHSGKSCSSALEIPARLHPVIWFLEETLESQFDPEHLDRIAYGAAWGPILEALSIALRQKGERPPEDGSTQGWVVEEQPVRKGSTLSSPEDLEFVSGFQSVQNADPLADVRLLSTARRKAD